MKITLNDAQVKDRKDFIAKIYAGDRDDFNFLLVECNGRHYKTRINDATRLYFVLDGEGTFVIDDKKEQANPNDLFIIENGQVYEYEGKMRLIEVNVPATTDKNEEKLD